MNQVVIPPLSRTVLTNRMTPDSSFITDKLDSSFSKVPKLYQTNDPNEKYFFNYYEKALETNTGLRENIDRIVRKKAASFSESVLESPNVEKNDSPGRPTSRPTERKKSAVIQFIGEMLVDMKRKKRENQIIHSNNKKLHIRPYSPLPRRVCQPERIETGTQTSKKEASFQFVTESPQNQINQHGATFTEISFDDVIDPNRSKSDKKTAPFLMKPKDKLVFSAIRDHTSLINRPQPPLPTRRRTRIDLIMPDSEEKMRRNMLNIMKDRDELTPLRIFRKMLKEQQTILLKRASNINKDTGVPESDQDMLIK
eukprot:TRINITY_DN2812_c0_g1_i10.p1 TRINITY_DN2812_c0_g1~~TRINITY_DN2812_c0_g1_i10.p1  ORF type:complete len:311 (-),score=54.90 TRINITY_DN2812_c0_g1_i10:581-1513(-)